MSKWLKFGINCVIVLGRIGIVFAYVLIILPLGNFYPAFKGVLPQHILHSDEFLLLPGKHTVTAAAMQSFPNWPYAILILIGTAILGWALIKHLRALIVILTNLREADYFAITTVSALRQLFIARIAMIVSDVFLASGNQLTRNWFYVVNNGGLMGATWSTAISDFWVSIFFGVIYVAYRYTLTLKTENDLTI
ncbi:hypothetical protein [Levilactobacillus sp. N40-8-2]|uniref:hypothetical protein n=1 Tax=Levilactobacillus muriae TaxID=3238987 RepID=UPI0038B23C73